MLGLLLREPFSGMTPALYETLSDRELVESYFAPRDEQYRLIPLRRRQREREDEIRNRRLGLDRRGYPKLERIGLTQELLQQALAVNPRISPFYCASFFQVWHNRGLPFPEIWKRWEAKARAGLGD